MKGLEYRLYLYEKRPEIGDIRMEIHSDEQDGDPEHDPHYGPPCQAECEEERGEEEICGNDRYIHQEIYEQKERKENRTGQYAPGNGGIDGGEYIAGRDLVYHMIVDRKNGTESYLQDGSHDREGFHHEGIHEEVGETGSERLEYDRQERDDEDILEIQSLKLVCNGSDHKRSERDLPNHAVIGPRGLYCGSHIGPEAGSNGSVSP